MGFFVLGSLLFVVEGGWWLRVLVGCVGRWPGGFQPGGRHKICRGRQAPDVVRILGISARRAAHAFEVGFAG